MSDQLQAKAAEEKPPVGFYFFAGVITVALSVIVVYIVAGYLR